MNATVYKRHPGVVTMAEESTAWAGVTRPTHLGGLGFGFKWNTGWMHDTLDYVGRGRWREVLNTDSEIYGDSGVGNLGEVIATDEPRHGRRHSARVRLPPAGVLWFVPAEP